MRHRATYVTAIAALLALTSACGGGDGSSESPPRQTSPAISATMAPSPTADMVGGDVYVFANGKLAIVDAVTGSVITTITSGLEGITSWDEAVVTPDGRRLFASAHTKNAVFVFDTVDRALLRTIAVDPNPVHLELVNNGTEVWVHSDAKGSFSVIDAASLQVSATVDASANHSGHGALMSVGTRKYYATNVNSPDIFVIDAPSHKVTKNVSLCAGTDGSGGTHGIGYSSVNQYAYVQCSGSLAKVAIVDTRDDTVKGYLDSTGDLYSSTDHTHIVVTNSKTNTLDIITTDPGAAAGVTPVPIVNRAASAFFAVVNGKTLAFVADLKSPDVEVVDIAAKAVVRTIAGSPVPSQGPDTLVPRSSDLGGGFFYTIARPTGVLSIIDVKTLMKTASVTIDGAYLVAYAGRKVDP